MKVDTIQTSFAGGEFGPALYGRTDILQYANACAIVKNMLVKSSGSAISFPGSRYVATVSDSTLKTRLIKFVFNRTDTYVIEMGDHYMRFFTNRGQITDILNAGTEDLTGIPDYIPTLTAHWKCNDNTNSTAVIDSGIAGIFTGTTLTNTASLTTTGVTNSAFNLGGNDYIRISADNYEGFSSTTSTQPISIVGWWYWEDDGSNGALFAKRNSSASPGGEYDCTVGATGQIVFRAYDASASAEVQWRSNTNITKGWHFIAVCFQGLGTTSSDLSLYVDGVAVSTTYFPNASFVRMEHSAAIDLVIGALSNDAFRWSGRVDNVSFWLQKLSAASVASLYLSGSTPYQISTVFTESEIFDVQYTQLNDVIWLTHPNHPPQKLIRTSANEWSISDAPIIGGPFLDDNTPVTTSAGVSASTITITSSATAGTVNITVSPTNASLFTISGSTLGHQNSYWMLGGLSLTNATTGLQEVGYVKITNVVNSYTATATVIKTIKALANTVWAEGAWSAVRGYPKCVTFHDLRLWFAATSHEPQKIWGSKNFIYEDFSLDTQADDDGLNLPLASTESNQIQWLISGSNLYAGTFGGTFVLNSRSAETITPDNAFANEESGIGSEELKPKKIGSFIYFLQRFRMKIREMYYSFDSDTFKAADRTILSPHILDKGVIDMDVVQNPETGLYCVLTSGSLAIMSREVDQEMTAWTKRTTAGTYTSLVAIPSQSAAYDEAWHIVERWVNGVQKKYVEFFENSDVPDRQDKCLYLDSALTYDAYESTSSSSATISLSASSGSVTITSSTAYFNGGMIGKRIRAIDADGNTLGQGQITATASTTSITLSITTTFNSLTYSPGFWGVSVSSLAGLSHLEAKTVGILADGQEESLTRSVASGVLTLGSNYWVISVGLSYDQIIFTLPKEAGSQRGTAQGKLQRFNEIFFKLNRSTQNFQYGPDADNLDNLNTAFTPTVTTLYTGTIPSQGGGITMRGGYHRGAQIYIKNSHPLPIEILSIIGTLETYEK